MTGIDLALGLIGLLLSIAIFSYLLGDNLFFRVALYLLAGVSAGYAAALLITRVIIPYLILPLGQPGSSGFYLSLLPLVASISLLSLLFPRFQHLARPSLAYLLGIITAVGLAGILRGTVAPQLLALFKVFDPDALVLSDGNSWAKLWEAIMALLGFLAVLFYFHHHQTLKGGIYQRSLAVEAVSAVGQVFIGISLAALFVGLYATALLALIERLSWLRTFLAALFSR